MNSCVIQKFLFNKEVLPSSLLTTLQKARMPIVGIDVILYLLWWTGGVGEQGSRDREIRGGVGRGGGGRSAGGRRAFATC